MANQDHSWTFVQINVEKTYPFWMKTYLIWRVVGGGEGVSRALTKKTYPMLFLHSQGPLGMNPTLLELMFTLPSSLTGHNFDDF